MTLVRSPYFMPEPIRWVAIIGSRKFPDRRVATQQLVKSSRDGRTGIVTGTWPDYARQPEKWGVDEWAALFAIAEGMPLIVHPVEPGPESFGVRAARRNRLIARDASRVDALWDGTSRGTRMTLRFFRDAGKPWRIRFSGGAEKTSADWWPK